MAQGVGAIAQLLAGRRAAREARDAEQSRQNQNDTAAQDNNIAEAEAAADAQRQKGIAEAEAAASAADAQRQKVNTNAADLLNQTSDVMTSMNGPIGYSTDPNATVAVTSLLETPSPSSTDTMGSLLSDNRGASSATESVASLLATPDRSVNPPVGNPSLQLPSGLATVAALDQAEKDQAISLGPDWQNGIDGLKDRAVDTVKDKLMDKAFEKMGEVDLLEKGINVSLKAAPDFTLGSAVKDKLIDIASDKAADAISDAKDNLACSGNHTAVDHWGCMVFMTPLNLGRGLYAEEKMLVDRFGKLLDAANAAMDPAVGP
jgi:flagellar motor protein MotB